MSLYSRSVQPNTTRGGDATYCCDDEPCLLDLLEASRAPVGVAGELETCERV